MSTDDVKALRTALTNSEQRVLRLEHERDSLIRRGLCDGEIRLAYQAVMAQNLRPHEEAKVFAFARAVLALATEARR